MISRNRILLAFVGLLEAAPLVAAPMFDAPFLCFDINNPSYANATGDFDGDGILDLAVHYSSGTTMISVLLGVGDGTFGPKTDFAAAGDVGDVAAADASMW